MSPGRGYLYRSVPELSADRFMLVQGDWPQGPHLSRFATVGVQEVGRVEVWTPFGTTTVDPGEVLWMPPGVIHKLLPDNKRTARARTVFVSEAHVQSLAPAQSRSVIAHVAVLRMHPAADAFTDLNKTALAGLPASSEYLDDALLQLFDAVRDATVLTVAWSAFNGETDAARGVPAPVRQARLLMDARDNRSMTVTDIAKACGLCRERFTREFTRHYGLPPRQWFQLKRTVWAKELIESGASITAAALESGFADQSHLHRWFRRVYLVSPGDFARVVVGQRPLGEGPSE